MLLRACRRTLLLLAASIVAATQAHALGPNPGPCGLSATPPVIYEHVVWIWFENHGYGQIVGSSAAPYFNRHLIPQCGLATNYHAIGHPSLPNYIAATSGLSGDALAPFAHDCNAVGPCRIGAPSLFAQAPSWGAYVESMPKPCSHFFHAPYAASHNPAVYYRALSECRLQDVGLRNLRDALVADQLPAFTFITPNLCHSMHSCAVQAGDVFLRRIVRALTSSSAYARGTMAILITFDESDSGNADSQVATVVVSPSTTPGIRPHAFFTHYSLLRTTEEMLGIDDLLGRASHAPSMRRAFNL